MNVIKYFLISLLFLGFSAKAEPQDPFLVQSGEQGNYLVIQLTSVVDEVTVNSVWVNRGGCDNPSLGNPGKGTKIRYGQSKNYRWMIYNSMNGNSYPCNVLEIEVRTTEGNWTYYPQH
ncbi:hypothetical protein CF8_0174 [Aeromonas phage CF8]|nr:hypothetical protein CF8_0174 [Aeromonas phage CF8]